MGRCDEYGRPICPIGRVLDEGSRRKNEGRCGQRGEVAREGSSGLEKSQPVTFLTAVKGMACISTIEHLDEGSGRKG